MAGPDPTSRLSEWKSVTIRLRGFPSRGGGCAHAATFAKAESRSQLPSAYSSEAYLVRVTSLTVSRHSCWISGNRRLSAELVESIQAP